jgi:hypothetical protein
MRTGDETTDDDLQRYLGIHQLGAFYPMLTVDKSETSVYVRNDPSKPIQSLDIIFPHSYDFTMLSEFAHQQDSSFPSMPNARMSGFSLSSQLDTFCTYIHSICPRAIPLLDKVTIHVTTLWYGVSDDKESQDELEGLLSGLRQWIHSKVNLPNVDIVFHRMNTENMTNNNNNNNNNNNSDRRNKERESIRTVCENILSPSTSSEDDTNRAFILYHDYIHLGDNDNTAIHQYVADIFDHLCKHADIRRVYHPFLAFSSLERQVDAHLFCLRYATAQLSGVSDEIGCIQQWLHAAVNRPETTDVMSADKASRPHSWMWCLIRFVQVVYPLLYPLYLYVNEQDLKNILSFVIQYDTDGIFASWDHFERFILVMQPILSCPQIFLTTMQIPRCQKAVACLWSISTDSSSSVRDDIVYLINQLYIAYVEGLGRRMPTDDAIYTSLRDHAAQLYGDTMTKVEQQYIQKLVQSANANNKTRNDNNDDNDNDNDNDSGIWHRVYEIVKSQSDEEFQVAIQSYMQERASDNSYVTSTALHKCCHLLSILSHFGYPYIMTQYVDAAPGSSSTNTATAAAAAAAATDSTAFDQTRYKNSYFSTDEGLEAFLGVLFCLYTIGQNEYTQGDICRHENDGSSSNNRLVVRWSTLQSMWRSRFLYTWKSFFQHPTRSFYDNQVFTTDYVMGDTELAVMRLAEEVLLRGPSFLPTLFSAPPLSHK